MRRKLALAVVLGLLALPATAAAATTRYATPNPDSTHDCSQPHPCDIVTAVNSGAVNDEVIVLPGTYNIGGSVLQTKAGMNLHGQDGTARPQIVGTSTAVLGVGVTGDGSTVRYLAVKDDPSNPGLGGNALDMQHQNSTAENILAEATGSATACQIEAVTATIRNSVCKADGLGAGMAASDSQGNNSTTTLRNVTAMSASGSGILADSFMDKSVEVNVANSIVRGGQTDVQVAHFTTTSTGNAEVDLSYSNWSTRTPAVTPPGTGQFIGDDGHNQSAQPQLTSDLQHELPGSPTIDAGVNDPSNGSSDIDGDPRSLGSGVTDIGADEFVPAPLVTTDDPTGVGPTFATLNGTVNPESRSTTYHFDFGTTTAYGFSTPETGVGSGTAPIGVTALLNPIVPGTTYHYRIVATSNARTSAGADKQFTTAPASGPANPLPTTPPFPALTLLGQTVTIDKNGNVTLNVTCPATAVGNCVGTDTLTTAGKVTVKLVAAKSKRKKPKILKLGSKRFSIPPGTKLKLKIKLSKTARVLIKKKKTLKAVETVVAHDSRNLSKTSTTKITLKAPKAKKKKKK